MIQMNKNSFKLFTWNNFFAVWLKFQNKGDEGKIMYI
jgi:hypothetical protein